MEEFHIELSENAKKLLKRKAKPEEMADVKGYKALKMGSELVDFTSASKTEFTRHHGQRSSNHLRPLGRNYQGQADQTNKE